MNYDLKQAVADNFSQIKTLVKYAAFKFHVDENELQSSVNLKLTTKYATDAFKAEHVAQFFAWFNMLLRNAAIDMQRKNIKNLHLISYNELGQEEYEGKYQGVCYQPDLELKNFATELIVTIKKRFAKNSVYTEVFERCFLGNEKLDDVAKDLNTSINNIKTGMHAIRKFAKSNYQQRYLIAKAA